MLDQEQPHVAAGWNEDRTFRWIEIGGIRIDEDDRGAVLLLKDPRFNGATKLSATELAGLVGHLAAWFADDPTTTIRQIENCANYVRTELEAWNDRARIDEEHPPYDELVRALDGLLGRCRDLREVMSRFADKTDKKIITVEGADA